jgi:hypothetical protein
MKIQSNATTAVVIIASRCCMSFSYIDSTPAWKAKIVFSAEFSALLQTNHCSPSAGLFQ